MKKQNSFVVIEILDDIVGNVKITKTFKTAVNFGVKLATDYGMENIEECKESLTNNCVYRCDRHTIYITQAD